MSPLVLALAGCGVYVPAKNPLRENTTDQYGHSREGLAESNIVANIRCEIQNGIYKADLLKSIPYLGKDWGTQVTLKLTWDELSSLAPTGSLISPRSAMQFFSLGLGASATAHATRLETVTFLFENHQLLSDAKTNVAEGYRLDCSKLANGIMIESDLDIGSFIYDKATLADTAVATTEEPTKPQFSTFQEDILFVGTLGGNITPIWKLTNYSADAIGNLASATRSVTGDVLITLGPLAKDPKGNLLPRLADPAASQHTAGVIGGSTATQIVGQTR